MGILDILQQYADPAHAQADQVNAHFDQVAQQASPQDLGRGVAEAFRSDATPPFEQMIGSLFSQSNPQQRAGILNQLAPALGGGAGGGGGLSSILGAVLGGAFGGGSAPAPITPEQASQLSPSDVTAMAAQARAKDPSIMERAGEFYAQHPDLVKGLGAAALAIALGKMHSSRQA
jgi:hypothetical protein